jgi:hypothetical protein
MALVVAGMMGLSLLATATGTARFAVAMGHDARIGYVVGGRSLWVRCPQFPEMINASR